MAQDRPAAPTIAAAELLDKYLLWCQDNRARNTFEWYRKHLQCLLDQLPDQNIEAIHLRPHYVYGAIKKSWSPSYRRGFMVACQRAYKWGLKQGYIDNSPLEHLEKPAATRRDNCPTETEYLELLGHVKDGFRDVLEFAWETGARPQEICQLKAKHTKGNRIEFAVEESKGKKQKRVIYLTITAAGILKKRTTKAAPEDFVFVTRRGTPWNSYSMNNRMSRLCKATGKKKFAPYDFRHAFATRMLEAGLDHITVAKLLGHKDASMLSRVYSHIGERNDYLLNQLRKVS